MWVRPEYLALILTGQKTVEVRVAYPNIDRLRPGDLLILNDQHEFSISRVARYSCFEDLLAGEEVEAMAPGLQPDELLNTLRSLFPPDKETLGVVALHIVKAAE